MTVFDITRMLWLARPEHVADEALRTDLQHLRQKVKLWGYFMQDHEGPHGRLTHLSREVLLGYDRILMTSPFGVEVVRRTIGDEESAKRGLEWMPHGLWMDTFKPAEATTNGGSEQEEALDPLEVVVGQMDKYENVRAAVDDLTRLKAEGKV